jgi:Mn-dependent DtxR family transcriptional regulator
MPQNVGLTGEDIIKAVLKLRHEHHACTVAALADELGISATNAHYWAKKLINQKILVHTSMPGSLRVGP